MDEPRSELDGEAEWWPDGLPDSLSAIERAPPSALHGWRRQRLTPLLHQWLYPCSWSMLLLPMGLIATLLDSRAGLHPAFGALLLLASPSMLGISLLMLVSRRRASEPALLLARGLLHRSRLLWFSVVIGMLGVGILQQVPAESNFWLLLILPTTVLWVEWFVVGTAALSPPSARWVRPVVEGVELPMDELLDSGWSWRSQRTSARTGTLAARACDSGSSLELSVERFSGQSWLVLSWWHPLGVRHDPFVESTGGRIPLPSPLRLLAHRRIEFPEELLDGITSLSSLSP